MDIFTVAFIGHREIDDLYKVETRLEELIKELLLSHEYVEFLVGRDGEFDQAVASAVRRTEYSGVCVRAVRSEGNHRIND